MENLKNQWKEKWSNQPTLMLITVIIWSLFIGLCIQAASLLFTFTYSLFKPLIAQDLYEGLNLYPLLKQNIWYYLWVISLLLVIAVQKAYLFYLMIRVFLKINLVHPFSKEISKLITQTSYVTFQIGVTTIFTAGLVKWLVKRDFELPVLVDYANGAFEYLLMSAIIFAIAQVFKRGVEIQAENELTV